MNFRILKTHYIVYFFLSLAILSFIFISSSTYQVGSAFLCAGTAITFTSIIALCSDKSVRPIAYFSSIYLLLFFYIPGLFHVQAGRFPWRIGSYVESQVTESCFIILLFTIIYYFGIFSAKQYKSTSITLYRDNIVYSKIPLAILIAMAIALLSCLYIGFDILQTKRSDLERSIDPSTLNVLILNLARVLSFLCCLFSLILVRRRLNFITVFLCLSTIPLFILANSPISIARYLTGAYIICTVLVFIEIKSHHKYIMAFSSFAAQLTLFPFLSQISRKRGQSFDEFNPIDYYVSSADFDGVQTVINAIILVQDKGLFWGRQLASAVLVFIPRSIIPWKSRGTGVDAATYQGYPFKNLSAPMPAELFVDFGYVGLVILTLGLGFGVANLDRSYEQKRRQGDAVGFLPVAFLASYSLIVFRGSLVGVVATVGFSVLMCYLATLLVTRSFASNSATSNQINRR